MSRFFSEVGISAFDFIQIAAGFILTMLVFFGVRERKHVWLNYFLLLIFGLQCMFFILFHDGLRVKLFAALMFMSTIIVEGIVNRTRRLEAMAQSAAK